MAETLALPEVVKGATKEAVKEVAKVAATKAVYLEEAVTGVVKAASLKAVLRNLFMEAVKAANKAGADLDQAMAAVDSSEVETGGQLLNKILKIKTIKEGWIHKQKDKFTTRYSQIIIQF